MNFRLHGMALHGRIGTVCLNRLVSWFQTQLLMKIHKRSIRFRFGLWAGWSRILVSADWSSQKPVRMFGITVPFQSSSCCSEVKMKNVEVGHVLRSESFTWTPPNVSSLSLSRLSIKSFSVRHLSRPCGRLQVSIQLQSSQSMFPLSWSNLLRQ